MKKIVCALLAGAGLWAEPWLTGPLIAPVGEVIPYGDFLSRSYLYVGSDRVNSAILQWQYYFGINKVCDVRVAPEVIFNWDHGEKACHFGDLSVGLDVQLMDPKRTPYFPGIKFAVREVFPTGEYQNFQPKKGFVDGSGTGAFTTQFALVFYKMYHVSGSHWMTVNISGQADIHLPLTVHGFNSYGGGFGTRGRINVGNVYQAIASFEWTLDQHWALALDNVYVHQEASRFWGSPGITFEGTYAAVGMSEYDLFSMAPAIEYNVSQNLGIIAGCWLSVWEKNTNAFRMGVVNVQYLY